MSGDGLSEEEDEVNLTHFDPTDLVNFEEAVKCEKWRAVMDSKIKAIERNNTCNSMIYQSVQRKLRLNGSIRPN